MFAVKVYGAVRRFVFVEGHSRREAARVFGLSRDTVLKMCRFSLPPGYTRSKPVARPPLEAMVPVIDAILEADRAGPVKQRHTAKRIFERLRDEHGFSGGYPIVKDYVRLAQSCSRETFVPLSHPAGHAPRWILARPSGSSAVCARRSISAAWTCRNLMPRS
jgi:transposase